MTDRFIKFADLPPDPRSREDLENYKNLGFDVCLLTEDYVRMVKNKTISDAYRQAASSIGEAGLDVWIRNMYNDEDYFECSFRKAGSNYGTAYELEERRVAGEFAEFPCITGFYMADEAYMRQLPEKNPVPWMDPTGHLFASFDKLVKLVDWKNRYYPEHFWHMNQVPGKSWDHYLPENGIIYSYREFLECYAETILKRLRGCGRSICLDNYPLIGEDYIESDYLADLLTAASVTADYNAGAKEGEKAVFGICIQAFPARGAGDGRQRDIVSTQELTFQMHVGMALGARLFEYFLYHTSGEMRGILDSTGEKRIYDLVKSANDQVKELEEVLCRYTYCGAFAVTGEKCSENTEAFIRARELFSEDEDISVRADHDTLVGYFGREGRKAYMVVNYTDPIRKHEDQVAMVFPGWKACRICTGLKNERVFPEERKLRVTLPPGGAVFLYEEDGEG